MAILQNKHLVLKLSALMVLLSQIGGHSTIRASSPSEAENFFQHIINNLTTSEFESDSGLRPSDIIFVLDRPNYSSALQTGFEFLLGLIQSFLENFNVDRDSSRVSLVISSKSSCDVPINDVPKGELSKCGVVYYLRRLKSKVK
ncbi:hypothetical protein PoB_006993000 [Plakobranchus ocellatus]|uniref:Uncharacterized protein n=1 Tax=Plakobranchus ocellatus TaxID=259542 RepID=A0AAV4DHB9_9GAST|nr:hypothetical protein PoB_006993000 [Plakobranchus ocellatus]